MARYGQVFKERAVARLLPPESSSVVTVARELGVAPATLERWRAQALAEPERQRVWTATARLDAVIATAALDEAGRSAWCREQGVYPSELESWRQSATAALAEPDIKLVWQEHGASIDLESRQAFGDFVKAEVERWSAIARTTGLPME